MQIVGIQSKMDTANHEIIEIIRQGVENREDRDAIQEKCRQKHDTIMELQKKLDSARTQQQMENTQSGRLKEIYDVLAELPGKFTEYDDALVCIAVSRVKILSAEKIQVTFFDSVTVEKAL